MREHKYRAWDKNAKKFIYFTLKELIKEIGFEYGLPDNILSLCKGIDEITEYASLKDKNGKDIYEGDIITYGKENKGVIFFKDGCFKCKWNYKDPVKISFLRNGYFEVIGNIYEKPELIKGESP